MGRWRRTTLGGGILLVLGAACAGLGGGWAADGAPHCYAAKGRTLTAQLVPDGDRTHILLQKGTGEDQLAGDAHGTGADLRLEGTWVRSGKRARLRLHPSADRLRIEGLRDGEVTLAAAGCIAG